MCVSASDGVGLGVLGVVVGGGSCLVWHKKAVWPPQSCNNMGRFWGTKDPKLWVAEHVSDTGTLMYWEYWDVALGDGQSEHWDDNMSFCSACATAQQVARFGKWFFFPLWFGHNHVDSWSPKCRRSLLTLCRTTYSKIKLINDRVWGCESVVCNVSLFGLSWKASAISSHFTIIKHSRVSSSFSLF